MRSRCVQHQTREILLYAVHLVISAVVFLTGAYILGVVRCDWLPEVACILSSFGIGGWAGQGVMGVACFCCFFFFTTIAPHGVPHL